LRSASFPQRRRFPPAGTDSKRHVAPCNLALSGCKLGLELPKIAILECILGLICACNQFVLTFFERVHLCFQQDSGFARIKKQSFFLLSCLPFPAGLSTSPDPPPCPNSRQRVTNAYRLPQRGRDVKRIARRTNQTARTAAQLSSAARRAGLPLSLSELARARTLTTSWAWPASRPGQSGSKLPHSIAPAAPYACTSCDTDSLGERWSVG
jgi:hypothetical protein